MYSTVTLCWSHKKEEEFDSEVDHLPLESSENETFKDTVPVCVGTYVENVECEFQTFQP